MLPGDRPDRPQPVHDQHQDPRRPGLAVAPRRIDPPQRAELEQHVLRIHIRLERAVGGPRLQQCVAELLKRGYDVRTTVRDASREAAVTRAVATSGSCAPPPGPDLICQATESRIALRDRPKQKAAISVAPLT